MGGGAWSDSTYQAQKNLRRSTGQDDFAYSSTARRAPASSWKAHESLDPKDVGLREARDSTEHPESTPIAVLFDVTGSMGQVPRIVQEKLTGLLGLLLRQGYVTDPQILFGAIGDADTDRVPLQIGQFESDNRMDTHLRNIFLEGNGGGQKSESYELAAYFMARHTATDAWDKRGRKGYLFVVGDELNKARLEARHVRRIIGDTPEGDISTAEIWAEVQQKWETFYILPNQTAYFDDPQINEHWTKILGERLLRLEDPAGVAELIALTVGLMEDAIDLDEGADHLAQIGSKQAQAVTKSLAPLAKGRAGVSVSNLAGLDAPDDVLAS